MVQLQKKNVTPSRDGVFVRHFRRSNSEHGRINYADTEHLIFHIDFIGHYPVLVP